MRSTRTFLLLLPAACCAAVLAADSATGTAVVRVDDSEYTIPIECDDPAHPEIGLFTAPSRITRERTGRASGIRLTIRPFKETEHFVVSLDRYVAWIDRPKGLDQVSIEANCNVLDPNAPSYRKLN